MSDLVALLKSCLGNGARGIEIGAHSLPVPGLDPYYIDLVTSYAGSVGKVDIQADGSALPIPTGKVDYVCSSHVLEHLPNPLWSMLEWHRVLRPGGILYLVVPDMRFTFDKPRELTPVAHILSDFVEGTKSTDRNHVMEFIYNTDWDRLRPGTKPEEKEHIQKILSDEYLRQIGNGQTIDIHYHTFTTDSLIKLLTASGFIGGKFALFDVLATMERYPLERGDGIGMLLQKRNGAKASRTMQTFALSHPRTQIEPLPLVCPATLQPLEMVADSKGNRTLVVAGHTREFHLEGILPVLLPPAEMGVKRPWNMKTWRWFLLRRSLLPIRWLVGRNSPKRHS